MARVSGSNGDRVYTIEQWLGVNESPDSDTDIKLGEASAMTNFMITNNRKLQKRPGTRHVANLLMNLTTSVGALTAVITEAASASAMTFTVRQAVNITSGGILALQGATATVNYSNLASYSNWYWESPTHNIYKTGTCTFARPANGTLVQGGSITVSTQETYIRTLDGNANYASYSAVSIVNNTVVTSGTETISGCYQPIGKFVSVGGTVYKITRFQDAGVVYHSGGSYLLVAEYGYPVTIAALDTYTWNFYLVSVVANAAGYEKVQGLWSGRVDSNECIAGACNGQLWVLSEINGVWSKANKGVIDTHQPVHMFGYNRKLYILNGSDYLVYDGTSVSPVSGYVPLIAVSAPPSGGGTLLQRVNLLTGQRRVWFSPSGTDTEFRLPETSLANIFKVRNLVTGNDYTPATHYTVNTTTGRVTFVTAPSVGTNTIEISYTAAASGRSQITAMTRAELYNGANDNRVFLYGDGSNKAFYSGLDFNGQATAEYFPDLNVVSVGDSNAPLYDLLRHYDELIAFKDGSAHRIKYGQITLETGVVTAAFYVETINKVIGGTGYGQAQLVENNPRTLDGRSIYEWTATTTSGGITADQRNAQRISQKVETTLRSLDLTSAITFYDKINHAYYIVENGTAIVQNTENGAWYIYRAFPAVCMIVYKDEVYYGTDLNGAVRGTASRTSRISSGLSMESLRAAIS